LLVHGQPLAEVLLVETVALLDRSGRYRHAPGWTGRAAVLVQLAAPPTIPA
jgi:hypothetical protein